MPKAFLRCVRGGGKVRSVKLSSSKYRYICYPKGGGKPQAGHIHTKKGKS